MQPEKRPLQNVDLLPELHRRIGRSWANVSFRATTLTAPAAERCDTNRFRLSPPTTNSRTRSLSGSSHGHQIIGLWNGTFPSASLAEVGLILVAVAD